MTAILTPKRFTKFVPLRADPLTPDHEDANRLGLLRGAWHDQDDLVRPQDRQVEENVRMLAGQQWTVWHPTLNRFLDITELMTPEERRWRQRPVVNLLLPWFTITHARATEAQPIVTFQPGPDRIDAELAEVMDIAFKVLWREVGMTDVNDRLMAWLLAAGRAHTLTRINLSGGPLVPWVGTDFVPVVDPYDQPVLGPDMQPLYQLAEGVPFDREGQPRAVWRVGPDGRLETGELVQTGPPHAEREGTLDVDVLSPLQVRGSWGPTPWHKKKRHTIVSYHTPEEVWEQFGVEVEPDVRGEALLDGGELERTLFGTGFYGSADRRYELLAGTASTAGYVKLLQLWEAPAPYEGMQEDAEHPGGRWLVGTEKRIIRDGPRPVRLPYTSPLNTWEFIRLPGRMGGTTPQEMMNPVQRAFNDGLARVKEHVNLMTNPKGVIDQASGLKPGQVTNAPGEHYSVVKRPGVNALEYVAPPSLGRDVYELQGMLKDFIAEIGALKGTEGAPPTQDASGELIKELRFNSDRFLGPTMRRSVEEYARLVETWRAFLPVLWDQEKTLRHTGEDNITRTVLVYPHLFAEGKVDVVPDVESMLPEGRGERQARVYRMYTDGLLGPVGSPEALNRFYELMQMPHLSRVAKPGGIDRVTAEQENGKLLLGEDPTTIPVYEWYDHAIHLMVHEQVMKSPEFLKLDPQTQAAFAFHRMAHQQAMVQQAMAQQLAQQVQQASASGDGGNAQGGPPGAPASAGGDGPGDGPSLLPPEPSAPQDAPGGQAPPLAGMAG